MKAFKTIFMRMAAVAMVLLISCEDTERVILPEPTAFVPPVFISPLTAPAAEFLPEDADDIYETFKWEVSNYGINVSVRYEIQIDKDEDFTNPETLIVSEGNRNSDVREVAVSVKIMNDKMLALGLPGFQESTAYLRIRSTINGILNEPLYSNSVTRTATTYQTSECGNFCTVGIIGSASPGGWGDDTDMRLLDATGVDKKTWTVTVYLIGGQEVKFRAQDSWDTNWGATGFPTGTGTFNGPNITIPETGYYRVIFNDETGEYSFTAVGATVYPTIGVVGSATTGDDTGWGTDIDLTQDDSDPHIWTGTISLFTGAAKFRANDSWDDNWGSSTFPSGYGIGGGPDIPITVAGTYFIWFNDATGEYFFGPSASANPFATIGLIGSTLTGDNDGWASDIDLIQNPANPYKWSKIFNLFDGFGKFRADNSWDVNWGASVFPAAVGVQGGADIPVQAGSYFVTFNTLTGEYYFLK
jgi:hypothetical protein